MSITVIYHRSDYDGIFSREIAKKYFGDKAEYIGWNYGDKEPEVPDGDDLYMIDISVEGLMKHPNLTWIDHHKSAIEKYPTTIKGVRIDGVAACRLAWQYFHSAYKMESLPFTKQHFIDRVPVEPLSVRLAGEYDIWDKRDPDADLFQHGLNSQNLDTHWTEMFDTGAEGRNFVAKLLDQGRYVEFAKKQENATIAKLASYDFPFEGLNFLALNHPKGNSHLFEAAVKDEHDGLLCYHWDGEQFRVSLYQSPAHKEHDLSLIAVKYGGGGHKGACGFMTKENLFTK